LKVSSTSTFTYGWDNMNQLVGVKQVTATGTQLSVSYSYDVLGKRVEDDTWKPGTGTVTLRHAYDGQNIWADVTTTNTLLARYVYGDGVDQVWARAVPAGLTNAGVAWYLTDRQGSVRDIMNSSSVIVDHADYDGFGNATHTTITVADQFGYAGGLYSYDTKMEQFGARWYDPASGRWASEDPSGFGGGDANLYGYCQNDPTDAIDPLGLRWHVYRNNQALAKAVSDNPTNDTIADLGRYVGLEESEWKSWLTPRRGTFEIPGIVTNALERGHADPQNVPVCWIGQTVCYIPNTVFAFWGGDAGLIGGRAVVGFDNNIAVLKKKGFMVETQLNDTAGPLFDGTLWTVSDFQAYLKNATRTRRLQGVYFYGHGAQEEICLLATQRFNPWGYKWHLSYLEWQAAQRYHLGLGILVACDSDSFKRLFTPDDDGGIFVGYCGLKWPNPFGADANIVANVLQGGKQGTKP
jgi:RHS repeat-associated protein